MPITLVIGSSGSGKTTFVEDVYKINKCCYIRQYHQIRPYIPVCQIPNFDPTMLPFWELYSKRVLNDKTNPSYQPKIKIGGMLGADSVRGLSGGQRKMMLFELVRQRTANTKGVLVILDEPFAGVTDEFVPFLARQLTEMRAKHSVLLVTNDHVKVLTGMSDTIITLSATDRLSVTLDGETYDREIVTHAVAVGRNYDLPMGSRDVQFFIHTELINNPQLLGTIGTCFVLLALFTLTFINSHTGSEALIAVALMVVQFFSAEQYMLSLPDWRNAIHLEADALLHRSRQTSFALKTVVAIALIFFIATATFGFAQIVLGTLSTFDIWLYMLTDCLFMMFNFIAFGIYSNMPLLAIQPIGGLPFVATIFFSTTFSPGAGIPGIKALRYLFTRYYYWCALPHVQDSMEGCPSRYVSLGLAVLTGCSSIFIFFMFPALQALLCRHKTRAADQKHTLFCTQPSFSEIQGKVFKNHGHMRPPARDSTCA